MTESEKSVWYVLYVANRCERAVAAELAKDNYETCVPVQQQVRQWSDRKKVVEVVLFPNYVFVAVGKGQPLISPVKYVHAYKWIQFNNQLARVRQAEMALIRQLGEMDRPITIQLESLTYGDEVEIIAGALKNARGQVVAMNGTAKVQLAIPGLRCFAQVEVGRGEVRRV